MAHQEVDTAFVNNDWSKSPGCKIKKMFCMHLPSYTLHILVAFCFLFSHVFVVSELSCTNKLLLSQWELRTQPLTVCMCEKSGITV